MEDFTKPSITRLARRAGIKSISEECFNPIRYLISEKLNNIIEASLVVNSEHQTKTLMSEDVYDALSLLGENVTQSTELSTNTFSK